MSKIAYMKPRSIGVKPKPILNKEWYKENPSYVRAIGNIILIALVNNRRPYPRVGNPWLG